MAELTVDVKETPGATGMATATLAGSIDARTVISFKSQLESAKGRGTRTFVLDMERVTYINSTGLSYLISLADSSDPNRPGLVLVKVQAKVKVLFDMMGLGSLFRFHASIDEAVQELSGAPPKAAAAVPEPVIEKIPVQPAPAVEPAPPPVERPPAPPPAPPPVRTATPAPIQVHVPAPPPAAAAQPAAIKYPSRPALPVPPKAATPPPVRAATPSPTAAVRPSPSTVRVIAEPPPLPPARNEDWLSLGLGAVLIGLVMAGLRPPMASFEWASDGDFFSAAARNKARIDRLGEEAATNGEAELAAAAIELRRAYERGDRGGAAEASRNLVAAAGRSLQSDLRAEARRLDAEIGVPAGATLGQVFSQRNLLNSSLLMIVLLIFSCIGVSLMGGRLDSFALGFPILFALGWLAQTLAGNIPNGRWGVDHALIALLLGLLAGNAVGVPAWLRESLRSEFYLKAGLVIFGAGLLIPQAAQAGIAGILLGAAVVAAVGFACYWIARLFRVDEDFSAILSTSISVGGVPAMIAALLAVKGDRRKLPYLVVLSFLVSLPLIFLLPSLVHELGLPEAVGGAWLGATLDTAPAISSAGSRLTESATRTALSVKGSQDMFLLAAALLLAAAWAVRHASRLRGKAGGRLLWSLFPKTLLGFLAVSLAFSFLVPPPQVEATQGILRNLRETWFALAFVSIGMETRYGDLVRLERGRPAAAFLLAQAFNALCALLLAWLFFGGVLFPPAFPR